MCIYIFRCTKEKLFVAINLRFSWIVEIVKWDTILGFHIAVEKSPVDMIKYFVPLIFFVNYVEMQI